MLPLNPIFRDHRDFIRDPNPRFILRDAAGRSVELSDHLQRDLALVEHEAAAADPARPVPRTWLRRIGFRWPVYLRTTAQ